MDRGMKMARKICVFTGSRSEYGLLHPLLKEILSCKELELSLVAGGMHTLPSFGETIKEIEKGGFRIDHIVRIEERQQDSQESTALEISSCISSLAGAFKKLKPGILVVLGDRSEVFAAAIAAAYMGIPVAHLHGGDNAGGGFDELARGAITKLSHIHFPATEKSAKRIVKMGEAKWRIFTVGSTAIDSISAMPYPEKAGLFAKYGFDPEKPLALVVQHPVSTEGGAAESQIRETLEAFSGLGLQTIIIYPNSDSGGRAMIGAISEFTGKNPLMRAFASIPHGDYLGFMKYSSVMAGNSSSALIEAPFFHLAAVNIGSRQSGRERSSNVIDAKGERQEIAKAVRTAMGPAFQKKARACKSIYGDGHASERIVKVLKEIELSKKLIQKRMMEE